MADVIKVTPDVAFDEPFNTRKVYFDLAECCMATSFWSESVGGFRKGIFIDTFKEHFDDLLYELVVAGWYA